MLLRLLFHTFFNEKRQNHTYFWKYGWYWRCMNGGFVSFSLLFFSSSGCITPLLCLLLLHPQEGFKVSVLFRHYRRVSHSPKARVTHLHSCHSLAFGLIWVTCVLCPRARHQVVLSLVNWLPLAHKSTQTPDFGICEQSEKSVVLLM